VLARGPSGGTTATVRHIAVLAAFAVMAVLVTGCFDASQPLRVTPTIQNGTAGSGLWRSVGGDNCTWTQNTTYKGDWRGGDAINVHTMHGGPVYAQILDTDGSFTAPGCGSFWLVGGPWDLPLATPGQPFGPGDFRVGYEVAPGTYVAAGRPDDPAAPPCLWQRLSAFTFAPDAIIQSNGETSSVPGPQTVTIDQHDFGFSSDGCGPWTKIG